MHAFKGRKGGGDRVLFYCVFPSHLLGMYLQDYLVQEVTYPSWVHLVGHRCVGNGTPWIPHTKLPLSLLGRHRLTSGQITLMGRPGVGSEEEGCELAHAYTHHIQTHKHKRRQKHKHTHTFTCTYTCIHTEQHTHPQTQTYPWTHTHTSIRREQHTHTCKEREREK